VLPYGVTTRECVLVDPDEFTIADLDLGFLLGVLVGEGSFGGDGRQPQVTLRMHVRHETLFHRLLRIVPGSRLYGPYNHSGREYFQWSLRGEALRRLVPTLDRHLTPDVDGHAAERYKTMRTAYARTLGPLPPVDPLA
jgi:hypothetical protein